MQLSTLTLSSKSSSKDYFKIVENLSKLLTKRLASQISLE